MKLSVVVSAYNESKKIKDCLQSVSSIADEIIVIDNSSTDDTGEIAKAIGAKVFKRENNLMLNVNKNFGFSKAENDWILNLDADERVTAELLEEIARILSKDISSNISAFALPRKNIIFGKWIKHTGWYPDFQVRLFRKAKAKFLEKHVHEQLSVEGTIEKLTHPLLHESYKTISEFLMKFFMIYAPNEAENIISSEQYTFSYKDTLTRPLNEFINRFYVSKGYKDGVHGLMLSLLMAFYYVVVYAYVWEKQKFVDEKSNVFEGVSDVFKNNASSIYWHLTTKIEESRNPLSQFYYRIRRKMLKTS